MILTPNLSLADLNHALVDMSRQQTRRVRDEQVVLYAGASLLDDQQREMMSAELSCMPFMGPLDKKEQPGAGIVSELERFASEMACHTFRADWAEVRLPSCTIANLAVFSFFGGRGKLLLGPRGSDGGHLSQRRGGTPTLVGMEVDELPFDATAQTLDAAAAADLIRVRRPDVVMLGRSVILRPDPIVPVVDAAHEVGAMVVYDAAHVAGLIAGDAFPNPFDAGVDLMTMSTYKTLRGPTGAIVLGRQSTSGIAFSEFLDRQMLANQNASRLPAIISALRSCQPDLGYGDRVVKMAQRLKTAFLYQGLDLVLPEVPAASHQIVVSVGDLHRTRSVIEVLEQSGILVGQCPIPGTSDRYGLRFGSQIIASDDKSFDLAMIAARVASAVGSARLQANDLAPMGAYGAIRE